MSAAPNTRPEGLHDVPVVVTIWYLVALMSKRKFTKRTVATTDLAPAALAQLKTNERLRRRADRALLKRRRQKSGQ